MTKTIAILLFPDIEVLDFAGPFEVFSTANRVAKRDRGVAEPPFAVLTVAQSREPLRGDRKKYWVRDNRPTCQPDRP